MLCPSPSSQVSLEFILYLTRKRSIKQNWEETETGNLTLVGPLMTPSPNVYLILFLTSSSLYSPTFSDHSTMLIMLFSDTPKPNTYNICNPSSLFFTICNIWTCQSSFHWDGIVGTGGRDAWFITLPTGWCGHALSFSLLTYITEKILCPQECCLHNTVKAHSTVSGINCLRNESYDCYHFNSCHLGLPSDIYQEP